LTTTQGLPRSAQRLVGRDNELHAIAQWLDAIEGETSVLVIEGEPGMGKTSLWQNAVDRSRAREHRVLSCRPSGSEVQLAFAALADLLREPLDEILASLPEPQRHALEVALLLASPGDTPPDQRAVATALVSSLGRLSASGVVLVAVDDAHWLDSSSADVLEFAFRRLPDLRVGVLLARRPQPEARSLERRVENRPVTRISLAPLPLGGVHRLLTGLLGTGLGRQVLERVHAASGGNPLFALELGRALDEAGGRLGLDGELPVPERLEDLLAERIEAVPPETRELLAMAALLSGPRLASLELAAGRPAGELLAPALDAGLVSVERERLRFEHPLLASACLRRLDAESRRALHRRLASVVESREERARHLALAAEGPDAGLAAMLEEAATASVERGARSAAAELLDHARRLTPQTDDVSWARRSTTMADLLYHHVDQREARRVAEEVIARAGPGPDRALALALSAFYVPTLVDRYDQALAEAGADPALRARIGLMAARTRATAGDFRGRAAGVAATLEDARRSGIPELISEALTSKAISLLWLTDAARLDPAAARACLLEALEIDRRVEPASIPSRGAGGPLYYLGGYASLAEADDESDRFQIEVITRARESGDDTGLPSMLLDYGETFRKRGDLGRALEVTVEGLEIAERDGNVQARAGLLAHVALIQAFRGPLEDARETLASARHANAEIGDRRFILMCRAVAAVIASSTGDHAGVLREAGTLAEELEAVGKCDRGTAAWVAAGEEIEAHVALGDLDAARKRVDLHEQRSRALERRRPLGVALRGRGLLLAAEGDLEGALEAFDASRAELAGITAPFEDARTVLALGMVYRRERRQRAARETLRDALAAFERIGAAPWADKTRAALNRIGGRAPADGELTAAERRVALLVAAGHSNREVAATLFLAPRTVEWNLSRIYAKLGVRSRSELGRRLAPDESANKGGFE
jgi:DNA-binding CsgD family transcriptional regulator